MNVAVAFSEAGDIKVIGQMIGIIAILSRFVSRNVMLKEITLRTGIIGGMKARQAIKGIVEREINSGKLIAEEATMIAMAEEAVTFMKIELHLNGLKTTTEIIVLQKIEGPEITLMKTEALAVILATSVPMIVSSMKIEILLINVATGISYKKEVEVATPSTTEVEVMIIEIIATEATA